MTTWAKEQQRLMIEELWWAILEGKDRYDILNVASRCLIAGCRRSTVQKILDNSLASSVDIGQQRV